MRLIGRSVTKLFIGILAAITAAACAPEKIPPTLSKAPEPGTEPIILDTYVAPNILSNMILPIYIEAQDPDGNMAGIWFVVTQVGVNPESTHYIPLSNRDRKAFKGFVTIDIPKLDTTEKLRIEITVVDQKGAKSKTVVKESLIGFAFPDPPPAKWKSPDVHKLGHIFFDFIRDQEMERL